VEEVTKPLRDKILEYLESVGCARVDDIAANVGRSVKTTYSALERLARRGYIVQKIDRGDMRRRIYCINQDKVGVKVVKLELPAG